MCSRYSTLGQRKQSLSQQGRCFICLKIGHMMKECPSVHKKSCCYCGRRGNHNRCLCPQKFPNLRTETLNCSESDLVEIGTQGTQTTKPPGGTQSIQISKHPEYSDY